MAGVLPSSYLLDPKIAAYAVAAEPAWLWSADGTQVLWANAAGAIVFGAATAASLTSRKFEPSDRAAQQVARMADTLTHDGAARLERFTGFGSSLLRPLTCICSRVTLGEEPAAILICGVEPLRPPLPLVDRLQRLLVDTSDAVAAFTTAGDLVFATASARIKLPSPNTFEALGAGELATKAINEGTSAGNVETGDVKLWRVGRQGETLVMLRFEEPREAAIVSPESAGTETIEQEPPAPQKPGQDPAINISKAVALAKEHGASSARRHPLRFVWRMDTEQHFTLVSDEFLTIASTATAQNNGARWPDLCAALAIDPLGSVAAAIATRDTWSGIVLSWPTHAGDHLTVELAGLPIFDRQREFTGYRGFGVCRDTAHLARLAQHTRPAEAGPPRAKASEEPVVMPEPAPVTPQPASPMLTLVPAAANVVPFPAALPVESRTPGLTAGDRKVFSDIAQQLAARLKNAAPAEDIVPTPPAPLRTGDTSGRIDGRADVVSDADSEARPNSQVNDNALFDHLPFGILIYRAQELLYANRTFLSRVGHGSLEAFAENGGLDNLLLAPGTDPRHDPSSRRLTIETTDHGSVDVDAWLLPAPYQGEPAYALILDNPPRPGSNAAPTRASIREQGHDRALDKILEQQLSDARRRIDQTATEHVALLGNLSRDIRTPLTAIVGFAESILSEQFGPIGNERYRDYLSGIRNAGSRILDLVQHLGEAPAAEVVTAPLGEAVKPPSANSAVDLNLIVQACVSELQADAARERVLIRTSLTRPLPSVAADAKAVRQIVQNLMTNSIKLAGAGGQVIVSTGVSASGLISLRLRDTGMGLNENELAATIQPAEARSPAGDGSEGRLKIAVAKALAEANRASLTISSRPNDGTLVEVSFSEMSAPAA